MLNEKMESLKNYLEDEKNFMELVDLIEDIFWETECLEWLIVHNMDEFDDIFCKYKRSEVAELIERNINTFTISDDLFKMDIYGELISYTEVQYTKIAYDDLDYIIDNR